MKGINNIRCVSQASAAITHSSSSSLELKPSSSSASLPSSSLSSCARPATAPRLLDGFGGGGGSGGGDGRTIDRYNPIVTDGKRSMTGSITTTTLSSPHPSISNTISPPTKPFRDQNHHNGPSPQTTKPNKKKRNSSTSTTITGGVKRSVDFGKDTNSSSTVLSPHHHQHFRHQYDQILQVVKKSVSKPTYIRTVKGGRLGGYCTKAKHESTRCLLDNDTRHGDDYDEDYTVDYLNGLSRFDPVLKLDSPFKAKKTVGSDHEVAMATSCDTSEPSTNSNSTTRAPSKLLPQRPQLPSSSTASSSSGSSSDYQVVVLRVSLHCRGCEGKVRKHISRMEGVTSFSIDFAAKKVTVVGDVTPLGVLASISRVKNAQLWIPQSTSSSSPAKSASMGA